jgi:hypothetical protein
VISVGATLSLLVSAALAGVAAISVVETISHQPALPVAAYLDAIKRGDITKALRLGSIDVSANEALLTDRAYQESTDHISAFTVTRSTVHGSRAAVFVTFTQGTHRYSQEFDLIAKGKDWGTFPRWKLQTPQIGEVVFTIAAPASATLNAYGHTFAQPSNELIGNDDVLPAFPGKYSIALNDGGADYRGNTVNAEVVGFDGSTGKTSALTATLTPEGTRTAMNEVNQYLASCLASTSDSPHGCPFSADNSDFTNVTDDTWSLIAPPAFTIGPWYTGNGYQDEGWSVTTTKQGSIEFDAIATDSNGDTGPIGTDPFSFSMDGVIDEVSGKSSDFLWNGN